MPLSFSLNSCRIRPGVCEREGGDEGEREGVILYSKLTFKKRISKNRKKKKIKAARLAAFGCREKVALKQKFLGRLGGEASCAPALRCRAGGCLFSPPPPTAVLFLRGRGGDGKILSAAAGAAALPRGGF